MEAFFIQKRFLLSALKPELVLKEENNDMRYELTRKDDLIRRHYDKIDQWKTLLADLQQQGGSSGSGGASSSDLRNVSGAVGCTSAVGPGTSQQPSQSGQMGIGGVGGSAAVGAVVGVGAGAAGAVGMPNTMQVNYLFSNMPRKRGRK